jgi:hypothetical protein
VTRDWKQYTVIILVPQGSPSTHLYIIAAIHTIFPPSLYVTMFSENHDTLISKNKESNCMTDDQGSRLMEHFDNKIVRWMLLRTVITLFLTVLG